ncbi:MAG: DnaJ family domain-containing protein [Maritimibacter harenae]|jgi:hypothetical protein|uniref:DUF1992 domain-containing protein n=1 Tax=Maritimibacter harenae TaxID=2606218 RepID=A0A845LWR3_9RHOB|nr:DUF1992 domain-containing protein [Maritimibacter harenae]MZR11796.1 DUF1992 domain-containing protein [Maritimibacter harenae]
MDHPLMDLISAKIAEAERNGEFDNLPGAGKPLPKEDDPENALLNRIMRENAATPPFVALSRELERLREELKATTDEASRREIMKHMSMTEARIDIARKAWSR